jgi:hypothetical protein
VLGKNYNGTYWYKQAYRLMGKAPRPREAAASTKPQG